MITRHREAWNGGKLTHRLVQQAGLNNILDAYFGAMPEEGIHHKAKGTPRIVRRIASPDRPQGTMSIRIVHPPPLLHGIRHGGGSDNWNWDRQWNVPRQFMEIK